MSEKAYHIRSRFVDEKELIVIHRVIAEHWSRGRSAISRILCERWNWRQTNGLLKDRACRVLLLALEQKGEITLPPRLKESFRHPRRADRREYSYDISEIAGTISEFDSLTIKMVRRTSDEGLWNHLVDKYHYLGCPWIVGSYLKYLVWLDGHLVACLGWGSAAWKVACRDSFIGWDYGARQANLPKVVNNVRFLILPWIRVKHLASKLLAANIRVIRDDWHDFYREQVILLETFVDTTRFKGTCYKAANWIHVGETSGRGKYDRYNNYSKPIKAVYLYPLAKDFRQALHD
jgi:hypothetical protein